MIPLDERWTGGETTLNINGVYRRPEGGHNYCPRLPLRRHSDWRRDGFEFIALADWDDVKTVLPFMAERGQVVDVPAERTHYLPHGPFNLPAFMAASEPTVNASDGKAGKRA